MAKGTQRDAEVPESIDRPICSTLSGETIARLVREGYDLGDVETAWLINRGVNDVYEVRTRSGQRYVGRLGAQRLRPDNIRFETALLSHLAASGVRVAVAIAAIDGRLWRSVEAPEGERRFVLFEFLDGHALLRSLNLTRELDEETLEGVRQAGAGLAMIHAGSESYRGPGSAYRLTADYKVAQPLAQILAAPVINADLAEAYSQVAARLLERVAAAAPQLTPAICHGDAYFGNVMVRRRGERIEAAWFDFDECAPGFLAYDLAVFLWAMLRWHSRKSELNATCQATWTAFLQGYRTVRAIPDVDLEHVGLFVAVRSFWLVGGYVTLIPKLGVQMFSTDWLAGELDRLKVLEQMQMPA
jgi:Ser/Thr protein kinase RdoA (MazF antagonist)